MKRIISIFTVLMIVLSSIAVCAAETISITPSKYDDGSPARVLDNGTGVSLSTGKNVAYNVFFESAPTKVVLNLGTSTVYGGVIEVRLDGPAGQLIGSVDTKPIAPALWAIRDYPIENQLQFKGKHTIWICAKSGTHDLQSISMSIASADDIYYSFMDADYFGDIKDEPLRNEINLLFELGALSGIDGNFNGKRIALKKDLVRAVGSLYRNTAKAEDTPLFKNITPLDDTYQYYASLCSMGYITADPVSDFETTEAVTLEAAVKWMIKLLNIESAVTEKKTPMDVARSFKLLGGIRAGANEKITRLDLAKLLINTIDSKHYVITSVKNNNITYSKESQPLISIGGIYEGEGVISATGGGNLYSSVNTAFSDSVIIDGVTYLFGSTAAPEYLGFKCRFFYTENGGRRTLVAVRPSSDTSYSLLSTKDTEFKTISDSVIEYYGCDDKKENVRINGKTVVMYNGRPAGDRITSLVYEDSFQGKILLINNDGDKTADVVMIDSARTIIFGGVSSTGIYDNLKKENIPVDDMSELKVLKGNTAVDIKDIPIDSVLDVYISSNKTGDVLTRMYLSENTAEGIVTARVDDKIVIDGTSEYRKYEDSTAEVAIGSRVSLALNGFGKYVRLLTVEKAKAAIVLGGGNIGNSGVLTSKAGLRLLTQDNRIETFECAKNVYFDGYLIKDVKSLCEGTSFCMGIDNIPHEALIRYRVNSQGKINMIDTKESGKGGPDDTLDELLPKADTRYVYTTCIKDTVNLRDSIPLADDLITAHLWQNGDEELYCFTNGIDKGSGSKELSAYTTNPGSFIADIVIWSSRKGGDNTSAFLFSRLYTKLASDGEAVRVICGYNASGYKEYEVDKNAYKNDSVLRDTLACIKEGDIITFKLNSQNRLFSTVTFIMHRDMSQTNSAGYSAIMHSQNQSPARNDNYGLMFSGKIVGREGSFAKVEKHQGDITEYEYIDLRQVRIVGCKTENGRTEFTDKEGSVYAGEGINVAVFSTPWFYNTDFMVVYN